MSDGHQKATVDTLFLNTIIRAVIIGRARLSSGELKQRGIASGQGMIGASVALCAPKISSRDWKVEAFHFGGPQ